MRALPMGQLHREQADAASRAMDQNALASLQPPIFK